MRTGAVWFTLGVLLLALPPGARAQAGAGCEAWPGEVRPLPTVGSEDAGLARWAQLRSRELATAAVRLEVRDPGAAVLLWRHVRCLDPDSGIADAGLHRVQPVAVWHPDLEVVRQQVDYPPALGVEESLLSVATVVVLHRPKPAVPVAPELPPDPVPVQEEPAALVESPAPEPEPETPRLRGPSEPEALFLQTDPVLQEVSSLLRSAHFEEALRAIGQVHAALESAADTPGVRSRRARAAVAAATAQLALGRDADADASLSRALESDPGLQLDPQATPPKLRRALDRVRQGGA